MRSMSRSQRKIVMYLDDEKEKEENVINKLSAYFLCRDIFFLIIIKNNEDIYIFFLLNIKSIKSLLRLIISFLIILIF